MEASVRWFVLLDPFYKALLGLAIFVGVNALAIGLFFESVVFLLVGVLWIGGGIAVIWMADKRESEIQSES